MAADSVYLVTELVSTSERSWEEATAGAVRRASATLRDMRVAEVTAMDVAIHDGQITRFRVRLGLSFKYESQRPDRYWEAVDQEDFPPEQVAGMGP